MYKIKSPAAAVKLQVAFLIICGDESNLKMSSVEKTEMSKVC